MKSPPPRFILVGNPWQPNTIKNHIDDHKVYAFLAKERNSFHLSGKKLAYLHLMEFLIYKCKLYLQ